MVYALTSDIELGEKVKVSPSLDAHVGWLGEEGDSVKDPNQSAPLITLAFPSSTKVEVSPTYAVYALGAACNCICCLVDTISRDSISNPRYFI